ncbi:MAG TPA: YihY/virulence factor BrkB family protein [Anaerolineales bacterium]|nr:YihY/virulence factor BrkB family protein [Anaerolineales bacterium]
MASPTPPKEQGFSLVDFFKEIYSIWISERPAQLAAALAYFGLFSFAPVIYIALSIVGIFFRDGQAMDRFLARLEAVFGPSLALAVQEMLENVARQPTEGSFLISLISFFVLLFAASGVFFQLQYVLNTVWKIPNPSQGAMLRTIRKQLFSFLMVITVGLLLIAGAALSFFSNWLSSIFTFDRLQLSLTLLGFTGLAMLSFAVMYKLLPDVRIAWGDVWAGAAVAASLVTLGGGLIVFFIRNTSFASALEAAGSFVVILTGFYYFAQIFLLGAVLTRVYAQRYGSLHQVSENHTLLNTD